MAGALIIVNIIGSPEAEIAEGALAVGGGRAAISSQAGFGALLGSLSGLGDSGLVAIYAGAYGAAGGISIAIGATAPTCSGH